MKKAKLFLENMFAYGIGGIITKLIPLIMTPIITRLLPDTSYYGLSDLAFTLICLTSAIGGLGIYNAMFRLLFDDENINYRKKICSTALYSVQFFVIVVGVGVLLFRKGIANLFMGNSQYSFLVVLSVITSFFDCSNQILQAPTRMLNKRKLYMATNFITPLIAYTVSIVMILQGYWIVAIPMGSFLSFAFLYLFYRIKNYNWFSFKCFDIYYLKKFLYIGLPIMINTLVYWLFTSCDRIMISYFLGTGATGIYSVGSKLSNVSQLVYTAFSGGWLYYAFTTMNESNQKESNSLILEYLGALSFVLGIVVMAISKVIFVFLFEGDYIEGYIIMPYLFMSPLLQMMFQVISNQFLIIKITWPSMVIQLVSATVNIVLNLFLIRMIGVEGAAIATFISYSVMLMLCVMIAYYWNLILITKRFILSVMMFIIYFLWWRFFAVENFEISVFMAIVIVIIYFILYKNDIIKLIKNWKNL